MKIKWGFISNSSSSSFILCGWRDDVFNSDVIKKLEQEFGTEYKEDEDYPEDAINGFMGECGLDCGFSSEGELYVWGKYYVGTYNDSIETLDLDEMQEILDKVQALAEKLDLPDPHFYSVGV